MPVKSLLKTISIGAIAVTAAALSGPALALPADYVWFTYYSDATYTVEVGEKHILCSGRTVRLGETTPYYQIYTTPCPNPPHTGPW
ncbi:DUF6289 family protein [Brevundimonas sp.]|uniref:DUF6289 family protein n=1 Tax=Brevundimonas sp. TaxID=1871086 RepID=UPI00341DAC05